MRLRDGGRFAPLAVALLTTAVASAHAIYKTRPKGLTSARPSLELMATLPEDCSDIGPARDCDRPQLNQQREKILREIMRATGPQARIVVAYMSITDRVIIDALCVKALHEDVSVDFIVDDKEWGPTMAYLPTSCNKDARKPNFRVRYLGDVRVKEDKTLVEWRIQHMKFLFVDPGPDTNDIGFAASSGNLTPHAFGMNYEYSLVGQAKRSSLLFREHECAAKALISAANVGDRMSALVKPHFKGVETPVGDDPARFRDTMGRCVSELGLAVDQPRLQIEDTLRREGISPLFGPQYADVIYTTLVDNVARVPKGGSISIAMQHFLNRDVANLFRDAVGRGVHVRLILDDDTILGGAIPQARDFYKENLEGSGMEIRFIETTANILYIPLMHDKFVVFDRVDGRSKRVLGGSCQFTSVAFLVNYENEYLISQGKLVGQFEELYAKLWARSQTAEQTLARAPQAPKKP